MKIKCLGTHNAESRTTRLPSFLIDDVLALDAGSLVSELSLPEQENLRALLLSHGHYDHIRDVPAFAFNNLHRTTKVFAASQTLEILTSHLIDGIVYPKFAEKIPFLKKPALTLTPLEPYKQVELEGYRVTPLPVNHPLNAVGFEIADKDGKKLFYTGDTGAGLAPVWKHTSPDLLITEVTFPNRMDTIAQNSAHLYPNVLKDELMDFHRINDYLPKVTIVHLSPRFEKEIIEELENISKEINHPLSIAHEGKTLSI